jgi:acetyl-CoA synthetase
VPVESEHALSPLHVSTTAKPKGICTPPAATSSTSFSHSAVFDIKADDVYWCAAEVGG